MERYLIAAFRSRTHTMRFYDKLKGMRVKCLVINTPREAQVGCGISVKFQTEGEGIAKMLISKGEYNTFVGLFLVIKENGKLSLFKI